MNKDKFYRSLPWRNIRLQALRRDRYICQRCKRNGRHFVKATTVHHILPRESHTDAELELSNLESLCSACHNKMHPEKAYRVHDKRDKACKVRVIKM